MEFSCERSGSVRGPTSWDRAANKLLERYAIQAADKDVDGRDKHGHHNLRRRELQQLDSVEIRNTAANALGNIEEHVRLR